MKNESNGKRGGESWHQLKRPKIMASTQYQSASAIMKENVAWLSQHRRKSA
jgi:hypothetical protein